LRCGLPRQRAHQLFQRLMGHALDIGAHRRGGSLVIPANKTGTRVFRRSSAAPLFFRLEEQQHHRKSENYCGCDKHEELPVRNHRWLASLSGRAQTPARVCQAGVAVTDRDG
jgi:hypothetical protein